MTANPGADELRIRSILRKQGVGPDADPAAVARPTPPKPSTLPTIPTATPDRDWLEDILDGNAGPPPADQDDEPEKGGPTPEPDPPKTTANKTKPQVKARKKKRSKRPGPNTPRSAFDSHPEDPKQSLVEAYARVPSKIRWLIYHGTAAAAGYRIGWVDFSTDTTAWIADHGPTHPQALFWYGFAVACILLYRRFSPSYLVFGWACTIPIASVVVGALLYGNGYHP